MMEYMKRGREQTHQDEEKEKIKRVFIQKLKQKKVLSFMARASMSDKQFGGKTARF